MLAPLASIGDGCVDRYVSPVTAERVGGNAANVAVGFHRHGHRVRYMGVVGDDADGRLVLDGLRGAGVNVDHVRIDPGTRTSGTVVELHADGERVFLEERNDANDRFVPTAEQIAVLETCSWVHAAGMRSRSEAILRLRRPRLSYDFSQPHDDALLVRLASRLDIAFLSGARLSRDEALVRARRAVDAGARLGVVMRGTEGSLAYDGELTECGADVVEVVDTLGAGDAFIAAAVSARIGGIDNAGMLAAGASAAAGACTFIGAWRDLS